MHPLFYIGSSITILTNDIIYEIKNKTLPFKFKISYLIFTAWAAFRSAKITTQTRASAKEVSQYFNIPEEDIEVISLGVDVKQFEEYQRQHRPAEKNFILYVGQAFPRRHLKETMFAFDSLADEFPELVFVAIGTDKYNPPVLEQLAKKLNRKYGKSRIIYRDSVSEEDLMRYMHETKLFIYISSSEAMGLPPLEALAAGVVPVVADRPETREIFGGAAVFVKDYDNPFEIAKTIREILRNPFRPNPIEREKVLSKYSWVNYTDKMLKLVRETAGHRI